LTDWILRIGESVLAVMTQLWRSPFAYQIILVAEAKR
jgi:hypothetical protein